MNHLERIAAHLGQRDAVLLTGESNCYYATGFLGEGAALITRKLDIITIGIGAGAACDGQVLVVQDMLGMTTGGFKPKMVRQFAQIGNAVVDAFHAYDEAVQSGGFPAAAESYKIDADVMDQVKRSF